MATTRVTHVPYWDGELWSCPVPGCEWPASALADPTLDKAAAQHYGFEPLEVWRARDQRLGQTT